MVDRVRVVIRVVNLVVIRVVAATGFAIGVLDVTCLGFVPVPVPMLLDALGQA